MNILFTIGHSTHELDTFLGLLKMHNVHAVADVRSQPFSSRFPQFSKVALEKSLSANGFRYVFLGRELGARREEECCYQDGQARYELVAKTSAFADGITRILKGLAKYQLALLCAEKDPITCHRTILVCRHLRGKGVTIQHILADGGLESQDALEERLLKLLGKNEPSLFVSRDQLLEQAYEEQGERIAYRQTPNSEEEELRSSHIS